MASNVLYNGTGAQVDFTIPFAYTARDFIEVYLSAVEQTAGVHYNFLSDTTVRFVVAPPAGTNNVEIRRNTSTTPLVDWTAGASISEDNLDTTNLQLLHIVEELEDNFAVSMGKSGGHWDATGLRITNVADPVADSDVATKGSIAADTAAASASADAAAASAAAAAISQSSASASAASAFTSWSNATAQANSITSRIPLTGLATGEILMAVGASLYDSVPARVLQRIDIGAVDTGSAIELAMSGYSEYLLELWDILLSVDGEDLIARFSIDGGSSYASADYAYMLKQDAIGANRDNSVTSANGVRIAGSLDNTAYSRALSLRILMGNGSTKNNSIFAQGFVRDSNAANRFGSVRSVGEYHGAATLATHIQILPGSGVLSAGYALYGVRR